MNEKFMQTTLLSTGYLFGIDIALNWPFRRWFVVEFPSNVDDVGDVGSPGGPRRCCCDSPSLRCPLRRRWPSRRWCCWAQSGQWAGRRGGRSGCTGANSFARIGPSMGAGHHDTFQPGPGGCHDGSTHGSGKIKTRSTLISKFLSERMAKSWDYA